MKILPQLTTISVVAVSSAFVVDAFSTQTTRLSSRPSTGSSGRSASRLFVQEPTTQEKVEAAPMATTTAATTTTPQPEETSDADPNPDADAGEPQAGAQPVANETFRSITRATRKGLAFGSSLVFNVIGIYFGFGLLLNLFGYAYSFSFEEGYKIDTIRNRRIELQFQRESERYDMERASKKMSQQQQSVAAIEAVGRADETTVTGTALATATATLTAAE